MNFNLSEISDLLKMRKNLQKVCDEVRQLTADKHAEVNEHYNHSWTLRNKLQLLLNLCQGEEEGCPIIDGLNEDE